MATITCEIEHEELGIIQIDVEYNYYTGDEGSRWEQPEPESVEITDVSRFDKTSKTWIDVELDKYDLARIEKEILEVEYDNSI